MLNYLFKWRLLKQFEKIIKDLQNKPIYSEFDLQFEIIQHFKKFIRNDNSTCVWRLDFLNCFYIGYGEHDIKRIYPDMLIFINSNLTYIIELKYFRKGRSFNEEEICYDLIKLKKILGWLNQDINDISKKVICIEFIIDREKNNTSKIMGILAEDNFNNFILYHNKLDFCTSILVYKDIPRIENRRFQKEILNFQKKIKENALK